MSRYPFFFSDPVTYCSQHSPSYPSGRVNKSIQLSIEQYTTTKCRLQLVCCCFLSFSVIYLPFFIFDYISYYVQNNGLISQQPIAYNLQVRLYIFLPFSPVHLPPVMPPDTTYRLPQGVRPTVLVIRVGSLVFVKDDHRSLLRILRIMQVPVMPGIPGHDRHVIGIRGDNVEILRIQTLQVFITEHRQPPFWQTTHPEPS